MSKALHDLCWHDGNLVGIRLDTGTQGAAVAHISVLLYAGALTAIRHAYQIECQHVLRFESTLDVAELRNNAFAGNISNGYLKGNTLWVYLADGVLQVEAKKFRVTKC